MIEKGVEKGRSFLIRGEGSLVIGRGPTAQLRLNDQMVSREHCRLSFKGDAITLEDCGSMNGTLVNGQRVEGTATLKVGDTFQVGENQMSLLSEAEQQDRGGLIGSILGGYRLMQRVGQGGAGTVYRAEQLSLKRGVALKVLAENLTTDPEFVKMFLKEARSAAQLNSPYIVQVHDVGNEGGMYFFSMEFMEGGSLVDRLVRDGAMDAERLLPIVRDAARGLAYIEKQGIVHRDIKPDNLMFTAEGTCKLGDLGIARSRSELVGRTGGGVFGSPHYVSPEQVTGKPVDARSDLYSLGMAAYRALSGHTPFTGKSVKDLFLKQVKEMPVPIQEAAARVPRGLSQMIEKMIQKDPAERFQTCDELLVLVESLLKTKGHARRGGVRGLRRRLPLRFPGSQPAARAPAAGPAAANAPPHGRLRGLPRPPSAAPRSGPGVPANVTTRMKTTQVRLPEERVKEQGPGATGVKNPPTRGKFPAPRRLPRS